MPSIVMPGVWTRSDSGPTLRRKQVTSFAEKDDNFKTIGTICLLDCGQCLIQIVHDVFDVFDSYRDAHHAVGDADVFSPLFAE
jgi:hypothetical protein